MLPSHLSYPEMAGTLYVSRNTIKTQASSLYRKLGVKSRSAAVQAFRQLGFADE
jgi:LuxR family maltose regulon positive regulatory protein